MELEIEKRPLLLLQFEGTMQRADGKTSQKMMTGYVAKFNSPTTFRGVKELIRPGAFKNWLADKSNDILALYDHDRAKILGRRSAGTLELNEDDVGLHVRIYPPDRPWVEDIVTSMDRGDIKGGSFNFLARSTTPIINGVRHLVDLAIDEITVTGLPVYTDTDVRVAQRAFSSISEANQTATDQIRARIAELEAAAKE